MQQRGRLCSAYVDGEFVLNTYVIVQELAHFKELVADTGVLIQYAGL